MKRSQTRSLVSAGTAVFGLVSAARDLRLARAKGDKLAALDAFVSIAAVLTGLAVAYRALREEDES